MILDIHSTNSLGIRWLQDNRHKLPIISSEKPRNIKIFIFFDGYHLNLGDKQEHEVQNLPQEGKFRVSKVR